MLVGLKFENFEAFIKGLTGFSTTQLLRLIALAFYNNHKNRSKSLQTLSDFLKSKAGTYYFLRLRKVAIG